MLLCVQLTEGRVQTKVHRTHKSIAHPPPNPANHLIEADHLIHKLQQHGNSTRTYERPRIRQTRATGHIQTHENAWKEHPKRADII